MTNVAFHEMLRFFGICVAVSDCIRSENRNSLENNWHLSEKVLQTAS